MEAAAHKTTIPSAVIGQRVLAALPKGTAERVLITAVMDARVGPVQGLE